MKGYLKSLYYWFYFMERIFLIMAGFIILMSLFQAGDREQLFHWTLNYLPMMGAISSISLGHNMAAFQVPQVLSYGSTRREAFFGVAVMTHIIMLQFFLLTVLCHTFVPKEYISEGYIRMCGLIFLICCSAGNGLGAGVLRFGSKAGVIFYLIIIVLMSGCVGVFIAVDADLNVLISFFYNGAMFGIVILFDLLMLGAYCLGLKNYEVRS